jgi:hypothetical protein
MAEIMNLEALKTIELGRRISWVLDKSPRELLQYIVSEVVEPGQ